MRRRISRPLISDMVMSSEDFPVYILCVASGSLAFWNLPWWESLKAPPMNESKELPEVHRIGKLITDSHEKTK